jgi:hypothetical protein
MPFSTFSSPLDSTFEQSESIATAHFLAVRSSSYCWPVVRGGAYTIINRFKVHSVSSAHGYCTNEHCRTFIHK